MQKVLAVSCATLLLLLLPGCGHPTQMTAMSVTPTGLNIGGVTPGVGGLTGQFKAFGTFIHPSETRDITTLVTWSSSTNDVATVDNTGKITVTARACGEAIITATANSDLVGRGDRNAIMTASATVDVKFSGTQVCP